VPKLTSTFSGVAGFAAIIALPLAILTGMLVWHFNSISKEHRDITTHPSVNVSLPPPLPPLDPIVEQTCAGLIADLPSKLAQQRQRPVKPANKYAAAWGDPPIMLYCGVPSHTVAADAQIFAVNGVEWVTYTTNTATTWTSISLSTQIELRIPDDYQEKASQYILNPLATVLHSHLDPK
jgi:hypothetical protein